ncbi:hypothetical protein N7523_005552 [Penicillium sp. IBT 18751x]|nr:hypothetical protein N7523_005552 [Penicillium sp. IBT 18751x]
MEFSKKPSKSARKKKSSKHRSIVPIWGEPEPSPETEPTPACANEPAPEEAVEPETSLEVATSSDLELPYKERSLWTQQLRDAFLTAPLVSGSGSEDSTLPFAPPKNSGPWEDFTPVFVEQARLYALADKYGIEALGQLVLVKLYETLRSFKLYETGVTGVVEFVRFVYSNTPPGSGDNTDALRKLVTRYVVSVLGQIGENGAFKELLEEGGPFVLDFWNIIWGLDNTYDR